MQRSCSSHPTLRRSWPNRNDRYQPDLELCCLGSQILQCWFSSTWATTVRIRPSLTWQRAGDKLRSSPSVRRACVLWYRRTQVPVLLIFSIPALSPKPVVSWTWLGTSRHKLKLHATTKHLESILPSRVWDPAFFQAPSFTNKHPVRFPRGVLASKTSNRIRAASDSLSCKTVRKCPEFPAMLSVRKRWRNKECANLRHRKRQHQFRFSEEAKQGWDVEAEPWLRRAGACEDARDDDFSDGNLTFSKAASICEQPSSSMWYAVQIELKTTNICLEITSQLRRAWQVANGCKLRHARQGSFSASCFCANLERQDFLPLQTFTTCDKCLRRRFWHHLRPPLLVPSPARAHLATNRWWFEDTAMLSGAATCEGKTPMSRKRHSFLGSKLKRRMLWITMSMPRRGGLKDNISVYGGQFWGNARDGKGGCSMMLPTAGYMSSEGGLGDGICVFRLACHIL